MQLLMAAEWFAWYFQVFLGSRFWSLVWRKSQWEQAGLKGVPAEILILPHVDAS